MSAEAAALVATSFLPSILEIFGIKNYKGIDNNLRDKLYNYALNMADKWLQKQQEMSFTSDTVASTMPNRNQLEKLMYQEFSDETKKLGQHIMSSAQKDIENWDNNKGWYSAEDFLENSINIVADNFRTIGAVIDAVDPSVEAVKNINYARDYMNSNKRKYKTRNANLLKAKEQTEQLHKSQKNRENKLNNYIIQSRDRFGKPEKPQNQVNTNNNNNNINNNNTELNKERTIRETKF